MSQKKTKAQEALEYTCAAIESKKIELDTLDDFYETLCLLITYSDEHAYAAELAREVSRAHHELGTRIRML